jgi:hypothetical protein
MLDPREKDGQETDWIRFISMGTPWRNPFELSSKEPNDAEVNIRVNAAQNMRSFETSDTIFWAGLQVMVHQATTNDSCRSRCHVFLHLAPHHQTEFQPFQLKAAREDEYGILLPPSLLQTYDVVCYVTDITGGDGRRGDKRELSGLDRRHGRGKRENERIRVALVTKYLIQKRS